MPRAQLCVPAVALGKLHWGRLEVLCCSGCLTVCSSRQGEPEGLVTAAIVSCSNDLISRNKCPAAGKPQAGSAGLSRGKGEETEKGIPPKTLTRWFLFFTPGF